MSEKMDSSAKPVSPFGSYPEVLVPLGRAAVQGATQYDSRGIIEKNLEALKTFCLKYLLAEGIGLALVLAFAKDMYGQSFDVKHITDEAQDLPAVVVETAVTDFLDISAEESKIFNLDRLIKGAISFALVVNYARMLDPNMMPPHLIPSDEVVNAVLDQFHRLPRSIDPQVIDAKNVVDPEKTIDLRNN